MNATKSNSLKPGDRVKIHPDFRNKGESDESYEIMEWNGDRGLISPLEWDQGAVRPQELVRLHQLTGW